MTSRELPLLNSILGVVESDRELYPDVYIVGVEEAIALPLLTASTEVDVLSPPITGGEMGVLHRQYALKAVASPKGEIS
ncbi:hypothetical protein [Nostoc sp.]|uniref:hypothetical protein n=1 Tax=Nostoc sp. TaxID=1180 RepID=UPI002FFA78B5